MSEQLQFSGMPKPIVSAVSSSDHRDDWAHELLKSRTASPLDLFHAYANSNLDARLRDALLRHASLTTTDLCMALELWTGTLRDRALSVARDPGLLRHYGESHLPQDRAIVAMNPACPGDLVHRLSEDHDAGVRGSAAACPNLPTIRRVEMARRDPDPDVREYAHWLLTTKNGRAVAAGERYFDLSGEHGSDPENMGRIISFGMYDVSQPPV